jgi:hypothetical protein
MRTWQPLALAAALATTFAPPARAQIDYRNLDDDRPVRVEDAFPIERYAFELLTPYAVSRAPGGATTHAAVLELTYGAMLHGQVGMKLAVASDEGARGRRFALAGARAFALYNLFTEGPLLPALALRGDLFLPAGALGGERVRGEIKLAATRAFGRTRLHANAAAGLGPDAPAPALEGASRWWAGAALDVTLVRHSLLVVGETYAVRERRGEPVEVNAGLGVRWQWTPTLVLDAGLARRLRRSGPEVAFTAGLSKAFAWARLMPGAPRGTAMPRSPEAGDAHRH